MIEKYIAEPSKIISQVGKSLSKTFILKHVSLSKTARLKRPNTITPPPFTTGIYDFIDWYMAVSNCVNMWLCVSWYNTLPFQTVRAVVWLFTGAPGDLSAACRRMLRERRDQRAADQLAAAQKRLQARKQEEQQERRKQQKERRRRHRVEEHEQRQGEEGDSGLLQGSGVQAVQFEDWSLARSGVWTDEDLSALSKLVSKYPPGVADRWPTIARALERTIAEVVQMTQMIRERPQLVPAATTSPADQSADGGRVKTRATSLTDADTSTPWTQLQQKALEKALVQFPKGSAERWERVAKLVPGKSKVGPSRSSMLLIQHNR